MEQVATPLNRLPKTVLRSLLQEYHREGNTLTQAELSLCKRICLCGHCGNIWVRQSKKDPIRCEACKKRPWNMPFLARMISNPNALIAIPDAPPLRTHHVDAPTPKPAPEEAQ